MLVSEAGCDNSAIQILTLTEQKTLCRVYSLRSHPLWLRLDPRVHSSRASAPVCGISCARATCTGCTWNLGDPSPRYDPGRTHRTPAGTELKLFLIKNTVNPTLCTLRMWNYESNDFLVCNRRLPLWYIQSKNPQKRVMSRGQLLDNDSKTEQRQIWLTLANK